MEPFHYGGQTYTWGTEGWKLNGRSISLPHQIMLAKAYLAELRAKADSMAPDHLAQRCVALHDLANTDPQLLESALAFCTSSLRKNPEHRGLRALNLSLSMKLEQLRGGWRWTN